MDIAAPRVDRQELRAACGAAVPAATHCMGGPHAQAGRLHHNAGRERQAGRLHHKLRWAWTAAVVSSLLGGGAVGGQPDAAGQDGVEVSPPRELPGGVLVHTVRSPYQAGTTRVRVLVPDRSRKERRSAALYVLPVEAGEEARYGDGLEEVRKLDLHNKHGLVCVAPTFSHLPWYADHPSDPRIRQETYMVKVVLPLVEKTYPVRAAPEGRLLLGFSKSGWGAWSLALRHPGVFGRAAAWDAPLMEDRPARYGMGPIFGTQENFEKYRIAGLLAERAAELRDKPARLLLAGYGNFREQHQAAHRLMDELKVPHAYRDGRERKHDWHSGWVGEAVEWLVKGGG